MAGGLQHRVCNKKPKRFFFQPEKKKKAKGESAGFSYLEKVLEKIEPNSEHSEGKEALLCRYRFLYGRLFHFRPIATFLNPSTKLNPFSVRKRNRKRKLNLNCFNILFIEYEDTKLWSPGHW